MANLAHVIEPAVALAQEWARATADGQTAKERKAAGQLSGLVASPEGLDLAVRFVDRVARPEDTAVAAKELAKLSTGAGGSFLSGADAALLGVGARAAKAIPAVVVPAARARLRQLVGHLVVDASDPALAKHLAGARADGYRLNINLLGEAVLGETEAQARRDRTLALLARPDVDYVSVKVSSLVPQLSTWDLEGSAERVRERLRPLYRAAMASTPAKFVNLDMEEYRDLALTIEVFESLLAEPEFMTLQAGIVLQAYLPDTVEAMDRLIAYAQARRAAGGAPIKIRLVKGANLAMERVEAALHGWVAAPYPDKHGVDANYVRLLERALRPEVSGSVRLGVASHNLYDVALAHLLATERGVAPALDIEMLQGMAPAQARAVRATVMNPLVLYTPVVARSDFDVAVSYLIRRLEENAAPENFLHALFAGGAEAAQDQEERFRRSVAEASTTPAGARRGTARPPAGAAFENTTDSDPALAPVRAWAAEALARPPVEVGVPELPDVAAVDETVARALALAPAWAATPAAERAAVLRRAADSLEAARGDLVAAMAVEGGKTVPEADPEVSEGVDFARYYAESATALEETAAAEGLTFTPHRVVLVTPPWNFPVAIPIGGVLAALAAGSAVIIKPAPATPTCARIAVDAVRSALEASGQDPDLVQIVSTDEGEVGRALVAHADVDAVVLTGAWETSRMFAGWRAGHDGGPRVLGETSGKNALVVTPAADYDLAVADAVRSAFGHAGQKCSAASLLILVGSAARSQRLRRQLVDAVSSLHVAWPTDLGAGMGPVIEEPTGKLRDALTTLEAGESWLVEPKQLDETGRLWSPGVKEGVAPGSAFHLTEYFGPVLGIMTAADLDQAIEWQNATPFGLTGGLHSLDEDEIRTWTDRVQVGNAYVNRHTTGAIVQRQPFGGWKRSAVGPGAKAGGPNYVAQLGSWAQTGDPGGTAEPGPRVAALLAQAADWVGPQDADVLRAAAGSDAAAAAHYRVPVDPSGLVVESNVLRYRPVPAAGLRAGADTTLAQVLRVLLAAACVGVPVTVSCDPAVLAGAPSAVAGLTGGWTIEDSGAYAARLAASEVTGRVRVLGDAAGLWAAAAESPADVTLLDGPVLTSGRRELLTFLREQAISATVHRFGHLPAGA